MQTLVREMHEQGKGQAEIEEMLGGSLADMEVGGAVVDDHVFVIAARLSGAVEFWLQEGDARDNRLLVTSKNGLPVLRALERVLQVLLLVPVARRSTMDHRFTFKKCVSTAAKNAVCRFFLS